MAVLRLSEMEQNAECVQGKTLLAWFRGFSYFAAKRFQVWADEADKLILRLYTQDNCYQITAANGYLGCTVSKRKSRPGESWTRGNDLPDGPFGRATFIDILGAIVCYELKEVVIRPGKAIPDALEASAN